MNNTQELVDGAQNELAPRAHTRRITGSKRGRSHGLTRLLQADYKQIDARCKAGIAMKAYRDDLVASLGGADNLSTQEHTIIELIAKDWLILQSIDSYLLQAGLFNKRKKSAYSLTIQRGTIADGLTRRLLALGLNRRSKPVQSLAQLLQGAPQTEQNQSR